MNTCAFLLILTVQIYADGIEGPTGKTYFRLHLSGAAEKFHSGIGGMFEGKPGRVRPGCQLCHSAFLTAFAASGGDDRGLNPRSVTL